jgi:hypothetical protein
LEKLKIAVSGKGRALATGGDMLLTEIAYSYNARFHGQVVTIANLQRGITKFCVFVQAFGRVKNVCP